MPFFNEYKVTVKTFEENVEKELWIPISSFDSSETQSEIFVYKDSATKDLVLYNPVTMTVRQMNSDF